MDVIHNQNILNSISNYPVIDLIILCLFLIIKRTDENNIKGISFWILAVICQIIGVMTGIVGAGHPVATGIKNIFSAGSYLFILAGLERFFSNPGGLFIARRVSIVLIVGLGTILFIDNYILLDAMMLFLLILYLIQTILWKVLSNKGTNFRINRLSAGPMIKMILFIITTVVIIFVSEWLNSGDHNLSNFIILLSDITGRIFFLAVTLTFAVIWLIREIKGIQSLQKKYNRILNISPVPMTLTRMWDGLVVDFNDAFLNLSGYTAGDLTGRTALELDVWTDRNVRDETIMELKNFNTVHKKELNFRSKKGEFVKHLFSAEILILNGESYILSTFELAHDNKVQGDDNISILEARLYELMTKDKLYLDPNLSLSAVADALSTNKTYVSQIINRKFGRFNDYLNQMRIMEACRLIQQGDDKTLTIDHLYSKAGFSSKTTFYVAFKKVTGVSPAYYLRLNSPKVFS